MGFLWQKNLSTYVGNPYQEIGADFFVPIPLDSNPTTNFNNEFFNEFDLPPNSVDVAISKTATASGIEFAGVEADKAVDNNSGTRWSSNRADNAWWSVDLGSVVRVGLIEFDWENSCPVLYSLQVSDDNLNWKTVYTKDIPDTFVNTKYREFFPEGIIGRYFKIQGIERKFISGYKFGYSAFRFGFYESRGHGQNIHEGAVASDTQSASGTGIEGVHYADIWEPSQGKVGNSLPTDDLYETSSAIIFVAIQADITESTTATHTQTANVIRPELAFWVQETAGIELGANGFVKNVGGGSQNVRSGQITTAEDFEVSWFYTQESRGIRVGIQSWNLTPSLANHSIACESLVLNTNLNYTEFDVYKGVTGGRAPNGSTITSLKLRIRINRVTNKFYIESSVWTGSAQENGRFTIHHTSDGNVSGDYRVSLILDTVNQEISGLKVGAVNGLTSVVETANATDHQECFVDEKVIWNNLSQARYTTAGVDNVVATQSNSLASTSQIIQADSDGIFRYKNDPLLWYDGAGVGTIVGLIGAAESRLFANVDLGLLHDDFGVSTYENNVYKAAGFYSGTQVFDATDFRFRVDRATQRLYWDWSYDNGATWINKYTSEGTVTGDLEGVYISDDASSGVVQARIGTAKGAHSVRENVTSTTAESATRDTVATITEAVTALEDSSATVSSGGISADITESTTAGESESALRDTVASSTEATTGTDTESATAQLVATITESTTASDTQSGALVRVASITESTTATDTESALELAVASVTESASASDSSSAITSGTILGDITESTTAVHSQSATITAIGSQVEPTTSTESTSANRDTVASITESTSATEVTSSLIVKAVSITESTTANDNQSANLQSIAIASEGASGTDSLSAVVVPPSSLVEAATGDSTQAGYIVRVSVIVEITFATDTSAQGVQEDVTTYPEIEVKQGIITTTKPTAIINKEILSGTILTSMPVWKIKISNIETDIIIN